MVEEDIDTKAVLVAVLHCSHQCLWDELRTYAEEEKIKVLISKVKKIKFFKTDTRVMQNQLASK